MAPPQVSIIMATFNRSNILGYSIGTVLRQTYANWELIVVGDACTDDTEAVVRGFSDPRIRFVNLPQNHGEQSGPNNAGVSLATGEYLAFLNHDDLWWPDHLETAVSLLSDAKTDLAYSWSVAIRGDGSRGFIGLGPGKEYNPRTLVPASSWIFKRSLVEKVGPWRTAWSLVNMPSQDWIFRAWKRGARMVCTKHVSCLLIYSGDRENSYSSRQFHEQQALYEGMRNPELRSQLMEQAVDSLYQRGLKRDLRSITIRFVGPILYTAMIWLRVSPITLPLFLKYKRKGGFLDALRKIRGLPQKERS